MTVYLIVVCSKCGRFLLAEAEKKTRTCPYCGFKVVLDKAIKVGSTENANKASMMLRKLKKEAFLKGKHANHLRQS